MRCFAVLWLFPLDCHDWFGLLQSLGVDGDGLPAIPGCSVEIRDMLSPFMPLKVSQKRSKRSTAAKQATTATVPPTSTVDGRPLRRDDATSHGFRSEDAAAAVAGGPTLVESAEQPAKPPAKKSRKGEGGKPLSGYCEFCEASFDDMKDVRCVSVRLSDWLRVLIWFGLV